MNTDPVTAPIDFQRRTWQLLADAAEKADVAPERFVDYLTADVAHTDSEPVYTENKLTLYRYEPETRRHETPILIVYALVNRPYILDLQPDRSVIRRLLEHGFAVYLVDWGEPSLLDQSLGMADYIERYLDNCVEAVCADDAVDDLHLLGYCMGGTLSIIYATQHADRVRTLTSLATPLAFEGTGGVLEQWVTHLDPGTIVDALGNVPAELLAVGFSMMNPVQQYVTKYVTLYENIGDEAFVENFARMERWIWDGVDVAGEAFREFADEIYKQNRLVEGEYHLDGERIDLADIEMPTQQIVGEYDNIVPPESSRPLHDLVSSDDERLIEFSAGHIGISVSGAAHEELWPDVCAWFAERDASNAGRSDPATAGHETAVQQIDGIGPTYADRLAEAGVETVADLRGADPATLADVAEVSVSRAETWLERTS